MTTLLSFCTNAQIACSLVNPISVIVRTSASLYRTIPLLFALELFPKSAEAPRCKKEDFLVGFLLSPPLLDCRGRAFIAMGILLGFCILDVEL